MTVTPAMASRIELWPLDRLKPYAKNARTHSDAQIAQIAASIVEFGFTAPILVSEDGGILAGHGRLAAAQKLALDVVPVATTGRVMRSFMGESPALGREANARPRNDSAHRNESGGRSYQQYMNTVPCVRTGFNQVSENNLKKFSASDRITPPVAP